MWLSALVLVLAVPAPAIQVESAGGCPSAAAVQAALAALVGAAEGPPSGARARVAAGDGRLDIALLRADGARLAERHVAASGSCAALAETAALVIAVWESDVRQGRVPAVEPLPAPEAIAVASAGAPASVWELGLGLAAWMGGDTLAPGAMGEGAWSPHGGAWEAWAALSVVAAHIAPLGPGTLRWQRISLALGPRRRLAVGALALDLGAGLAAAVVMLQGRGFPQSLSARDFDPGAVAGLRLGRADGGGAWIGVELAGHLRDRVARVDGVDARWHFPRLDAQLTLGMTHRWGL